MSPEWKGNFFVVVFVTVYALKECELNGSWYRHPDTQKPWSNYTPCIDQSDLYVSINR